MRSTRTVGRLRRYEKLGKTFRALESLSDRCIRNFVGSSTVRTPTTDPQVAARSRRAVALALGLFGDFSLVLKVRG